MKTSLLDSEVSPYQDTTTAVMLDDADEHSHLRPQYINEEEMSYFQSLDSETVKTKEGNQFCQHILHYLFAFDFTFHFVKIVLKRIVSLLFVGRNGW